MIELAPGDTDKGPGGAGSGGGAAGEARATTKPGRGAPARSARRRSRELAVQGLYQWLVSREDAGAIQAHLIDAPAYARADRPHFEALLHGAGSALAADGLLFLYGPFTREHRHTSASNKAFDRMLRWHDPAWGVRDLDEVAAIARRSGLALRRVAEMPANNLSLLLRRPA